MTTHIKVSRTGYASPDWPGLELFVLECWGWRSQEMQPRCEQGLGHEGCHEHRMES